MTEVAINSEVSRSGSQQDDCLISTSTPVKLLIEEKRTDGSESAADIFNESDMPLSADKQLPY